MKIGLTELFDIQTNAGVKMEIFDDATHPRIPRKTENYVFDKTLLGDILAFLKKPHGGGLFLTGPTGCGKTSIVMQVASRLNWPVQEVTCHGRMELGDLIGHYTMVNGNMAFVHGPLAVAVRDGHILVLNEIDLAEPSELAGLNGVLDGMPLVIPENEGEVITPHPQFRIVATGNSVGSGDATGLYQGVLRQNMALMDRFRAVEVRYLDPTIETTLLKKMAPFLSDVMASAMVRVANDIRTAFMGAGASQTTVTMSTRSLILWAHITASFTGKPFALAHAYRQVIVNKAEADQKETLEQFARLVFAPDWD